mgnify:CR=1 FL=1
MKKCLETDFKNVARIEAYVQGKIEFDFPLYVNQLYIDVDKLSLPNEVKIIPFMPGTVNATEKSDVSVSGFSHIVSVEWEAKGSGKDLLDLLVSLQTYPHELVFTFIGGTKKIVRTDDILYSFVFQYDNGKTKCSMTLVNGQGVITVV